MYSIHNHVNYSILRVVMEMNFIFTFLTPPHTITILDFLWISLLC